MIKKRTDKETYIAKAQQLKPKIYTTKIQPITGVPSKELKRGDTIVFDFGNHYVGKVRIGFHAVGSHQDAPAFIKIKFCEAARELEEDSRDYDGWISKGWIQEEWLHIDVLPTMMVLPRRYAFRYIKIDVLDVSSKYSLVVDHVQAETYTAAEDDKVESLKGNQREQKIDNIALRTLRNCMQDVFEDGPKRDRRLWIGDLRLQALVNYSSYQQNDLVKRCLYLFAGTTNEEGRVCACVFTEPEVIGDDTYMFDYSLFFISTLLNYLEATNDVETGRELLPVARRQVELSRAYFDSNHLVRDSDQLGWCFIDWNLRLNKQVGAQAVYIYCEKQLIQLYKLLGNNEGVNELEQDVKAKEEAAKRYLFDEKAGLFVSGTSRQVSYAGQAWMVLAGVFDKEMNKKILDKVQSYQDAEPMVTPYMYHHFVEALIQAGKRQQAYKWMVKYWGGMVEEGADTFYELFNPKNPTESPYGSSIVNSYCHAWSCTPTWFMRHHHLVQTKEKRGIIFDLDGVLVFTDQYHYLAWKQLADELGVYFDEKINNRLRGVSRMDSLEIILERYQGEPLNQVQKSELAEKKNEIYRNMLQQMRPANVSVEVRSCLKELRRRGFRLAIGSSSKNAKLILEKVDLLGAFQAISDGTNISQSKPSPEVFLKAAEFLRLEPEECYVVEDAKVGIDAAKAGGMIGIGIGDAATYEKADMKVNSFSEILSVI
ncbi:beta-phosphoglucomutase [Lachnospiraceae bacterium PF1-21]